MPTDKPMTTGPARRPWWVGPGVGAVLGALAIALAAQGSLAGGRVAMPAGPKLSSSTASAAPVPAPAPTEVPAADGTVVEPFHPVVTQSDSSGTPPGAATAASSGGETSSAGSPKAPGSSAAEPTRTATGDAGASGTSGGSGGTGGTADTAEATTATTLHPSTSTTTAPVPESGDR
jgi:hypothetical protein